MKIAALLFRIASLMTLGLSEILWWSWLTGYPLPVYLALWVSMMSALLGTEMLDYYAPDGWPR